MELDNHATSFYNVFQVKFTFLCTDILSCTSKGTQIVLQADI